MLASAFAAAMALGASAGRAEPVQLKFAFMPPPQSPYMPMAITPWSEAVQKASQGGVEIKMFFGPQLATYNNVLDRLTNGVVEVAYGIFGNLGIQFPKMNVSVLPFEADDAETPSVVLWRLYQRGLIADGLDVIRPLAIFVFPYSGLHGSKPIHTLDDMKGVKVAVFSRQGGEIIELLGGSAVAMQPTDLFQSLSRGVVQSSSMGWAGVPTFKLHEVAPQHVDASLGNSPGFIFMSKEAYARLPEAGRGAVDSASYEMFSRAMGRAGDRQAEAARNRTKGMEGQAVYSLGKAEEAKWRERLKPITEEWVRTTPNGAAILAAYRTELAKVRAGQ